MAPCLNAHLVNAIAAAVHVGDTMCAKLAPKLEWLVESILLAEGGEGQLWRHLFLGQDDAIRCHPLSAGRG